MSVKLFVGNLPWSVGDLELEQLFAPYAEVQSARVVTDRETGRSRGFGFVELETTNAASVISALNGREVEGRALRVNEAESQERRGFGGGGGGGGRDRGPRGGGGGYGGGGGGGYGGGGDRGGDRGPRNRY